MSSTPDYGYEWDEKKKTITKVVIPTRSKWADVFDRVEKEKEARRKKGKFKRRKP